MNIFEKVYLGDSVYVEFSDSGVIKLTTHDGYEDTNIIFLDPEVLTNFEKYVTELKIELTRIKENAQR